MKLLKCLFYLLQIMTIVSCAQDSPKIIQNIDPSTITKDFNTWWGYNYANVNLSRYYKAIDTSGKIINKEAFLTLLSTGDYVPFKISSKYDTPTYKLFRLGEKIDKEIKIQSKQIGLNEYKNFKMEGTELPDFNFTDIDGKLYNKQTTKDKIVVIKCWFIHCGQCVKEMPALNKLVQEYKNDSSVVFISLASDSKAELKKFLLKTTFDYAVVPEMNNYFREKIMVSSFPTHIILNREGKIISITQNADDMIYNLRKE
jgi:thiol-disulfide isomerase/thioredoxin